MVRGKLNNRFVNKTIVVATFPLTVNLVINNKGSTSWTLVVNARSDGMKVRHFLKSQSVTDIPRIGLVCLFSISTIVGYQTTNLVFTYKLSIWLAKAFWRYTLLYEQTVLFQTIQFSMWFVCIQFKSQTVLFDPLIEPYQVLPLLSRVQLRAMAKGTPPSSKLQHYWSLTIECLVSYLRHSLGDSYPFSEMQLAYSTTPANRLRKSKEFKFRS